MSEGFVLDGGALIALESKRPQRRLLSIIEEVGQANWLVISAGSIAEVWRGSARQAALARLLTRPNAQIIDITATVARAIGVVLGTCAKADDIVDAHVAMLARSHRLPVLTSDPKDLLALDPGLRVMRI